MSVGNVYRVMKKAKARVTSSDVTVIQLTDRMQKQKKTNKTNKTNKNTGKLTRRSLNGSNIFGPRERKKKTVISKNFFIRECFRYVEVPGKPGVCGCGSAESKHPPDRGKMKKETEWSVDRCTRRLPTDTYGEIEFAEDNDKSARKPYIRIEHETSAVHLLKLMRQFWKLEVPNLVISVTGGAQDFKLKPRLREVFTKGLIKVAASTNAWVITGGTNTGVMKHVGEAVKNRGSVGKFGRSKINVIGIAAWGTVNSSGDLISKNGEGCYPAYYDPASGSGLDHNHSHFLLVDNGTKGKYGTEIGLRASVEETIAKELKTESNSDCGAIGIPVVILCLEGGPNTIKTMAEAIKKGTPAVVIDGSGRAADVVSFAYKHRVFDEKQDAWFIDPDYVPDVQQKVSDVFGEAKMLNIYGEIEQLLKNEKMISIFRLDDAGGQSDMDLAILRALLKANTGSVSMQIKLALAWNRIDVAKTDIFTEELKAESIVGLFESMTAALLDNKFEFVELFLNEGLNVKNFLTLTELETLYNSIPQVSAIRPLIDEFLYRSKPDSPKVDMEVIGSVIEDLMGDKFKSRYRTAQCYKPYSERKAKRSVLQLAATNLEVDEKCVDTPYLDLFIWAVLGNRKELSMMLWERTRDKVACALMASKILKTLADRITDNRQLSYMADELVENGIFFEQVAVGVLNECSLENEQHAQTLLVKELNDFGHLTSLDIAVEANNQDFIAHSSCQSLLTKLWMGALHINTEAWKVLVCSFFPMFLSVLIKLRDDCSDDYVEEENTTTDGRQLDLRTDLQNFSFDNSVANSRAGSRAGSENSLEPAYDEPSHPNVPMEAEEDKHTILDHLDGEEDTAEVALRPQGKITGYLHRFIHFHQAPYVKFIVNVFLYIIFLLLYAYTLLTSMLIEIQVCEHVLQFWVFTLILEEIRQLITQDSKFFFGKLEFYLKDWWNVNDVLSLLFYIVATIFRCIATHKGPVDGENYLIAAKIIFSVDIIAFIIRMLQIFSVNRHLGPKVVMIQKMLIDLWYFVVILFVFIICYGVASQAVQYPYQSVTQALRGVVDIPYWQMYGELFMEDILGLEEPMNATTNKRVCEQPGEGPCRTEYGKVVAPIYMAVYMLFANILLLNLLIAIFNSTYTKVEEDSDKVWKFQRYALINEYNDRPFLAPPFIILSHIYGIIRFFAERCGCCGCRPAPEGSSLKITLLKQEEEDLSMWEDMQSERYTYRTSVLESETQDSRLKSIISKLDAVSEEIDHIKSGGTDHDPSSHRKSIAERPDTRGGRVRNVTNALENRLATLEYNMQHVLEILIQQNQNQAAILEASENIMKKSGVSASDGDETKAKVTNIHTKARQSPYPESTVQRFKISDKDVMWDVGLAEYDPPSYTSPHVLAGPYWADVDLMSLSPRPALPYNAYDEANKVNRISHCGRYAVVDGLPANPYGRTGIIGRGLLGRFGPNHAADPIATRWKRANSGIVLDKGKRVLEFIAIQRKDNHQWAIPGGMVEPGEHVSETLRKEFSEEALAKLNMSAEQCQQISDRLKYLFRNGVEVYKGYVDDPRNTDNAWMETVACNFHDDSGEVFGEFELKAGDDAQAVRWQRVSGNIPLYASHVGILEKVAKMHDAAFY